MKTDIDQPPSTGPGWIRDLLRLVIILVVIGVMVYLVRGSFDSVAAWLNDLGRWAPLAFVAVHVVLVCVGFPVSVLGFMAGASFGVLRGTLLLVLADILAAAIIFVVARWLLADRVRRFAHSRPRFDRFLTAAEAEGTRMMVLMRLSPGHYGAVSYMLGASRVRFWPYLITSLLVIPSAVLQAYMGHAAGEFGLRAARGEGIDWLETAIALVGIAAAAILLIVVGRMARRALDAAPETASGTQDGT